MDLERALIALACLLLLAFTPVNAQAEIHMAYSLEQMAVEADVIVIGTLTEIAEQLDDPTKVDGIKLPMTLEVERFLKGEWTYANAPETLYFTADAMYDITFQRLVGNRVLLFFTKTDEGYTFEDAGPYDLWLLHEFESAPYVVDLEGLPEMFTLAATGFSQPSDEATVIDLVENVVALQIEHLERHPNANTADLVMLECPFGSDADAALYSGSATYLYAPAFLFGE